MINPIFDALDTLKFLLKGTLVVAAFMGFLFGLIMPILFFLDTKAWKMFGLM